MEGEMTNANRFNPGYSIGSEDEGGCHIRGDAGWPYSIYRQDDNVGGCDVVLCHGIQGLDDAKQLLALCNGDIRPTLKTPSQMFAWD
jgi:hypothetical protein